MKKRLGFIFLVVLFMDSCSASPIGYKDSNSIHDNLIQTERNKAHRNVKYLRRANSVDESEIIKDTERDDSDYESSTYYDSEDPGSAMTDFEEPERIFSDDEPDDRSDPKKEESDGLNVFGKKTTKPLDLVRDIVKEVQYIVKSTVNPYEGNKDGSFIKVGVSKTSRHLHDMFTESSSVGLHVPKTPFAKPENWDYLLSDLGNSDEQLHVSDDIGNALRTLSLPTQDSRDAQN